MIQKSSYPSANKKNEEDVKEFNVKDDNSVSFIGKRFHF